MTILEILEDKLLEVKKNPVDNEKIEKAISALVNSTGVNEHSYLYFYVTEDKTNCTFTYNENFKLPDDNQDILNCLKFLANFAIKYEIIRGPGNNGYGYKCIKMAYSDKLIYTSNGGIFIRNGSNSAYMTDAQFNEMTSKKDLDLYATSQNQFLSFEVLENQMKNTGLDFNVENLLSRLPMKKGGRFNRGAYYFSDQCQDFNVSIIDYRGETSKNISPADDNVLGVILKAEKILKDIMSKEVILGSLARRTLFNIYNIDEKMLREILVNSIVHCNLIIKPQLEIKIWDGLIIFENGYSNKNLLHAFERKELPGHQASNQLIFDVFRTIKMSEGLNTLFGSYLAKKAAGAKIGYRVDSKRFKFRLFDKDIASKLNNEDVNRIMRDTYE